MPDVTVAIPVLNGGELFAEVLSALAEQSVEHDLVVCDSGSTDGTAELARAHGAQVEELHPRSFSHGGVRNRLMSAAGGSHVALLTQDSVPGDARWLERLLSGFELESGIGIAYGPYQPRPDASLPVRLELERWFQSLSPDGRPTVERFAAGEPMPAVLELVSRRGFFTDANACVSRSAWERVPFRDVPYAEDRVLAIDMMQAGYAKVFLPDAFVVHSHDYSSAEQLRRCFDEGRGLLEIYGWREPAAPGRVVREVRGAAGHARRELVGSGVSASRRCTSLAAVSFHRSICLVGALLGSRADRIPAGVRRRLSLEGRSSVVRLRLSHDKIDALDD